MRRGIGSPLRGIRRLLASFAALCLVGFQSIVNAQPFEVTLWVDHKRATKSSLKKSVQAHPCGAVVTKRLSQVPHYRASAIVQPDQAVEFSASGKILAVWAIPVDMSVVGVDGDSILVADRGRTLAIDSGRYIKRRTAISRQIGVPEKCPLKKVFGNSDYARCESFVDDRTKKRRTIGFEGVCT